MPQDLWKAKYIQIKNVVKSAEHFVHQQSALWLILWGSGTAHEGKSVSCRKHKETAKSECGLLFPQ